MGASTDNPLQILVSFLLSKRVGKRQTFRPGDFIVIKSEDEIRRTLDQDGTCEGLPFMPEMIPFCDRAFRVARRMEHVYLDSYAYVARLMNTVILEGLRCDGGHHGGCQMGCPLLWKEDWLRPANVAAVTANDVSPGPLRILDLPVEKDGRFFCQAVELVRASTRLPWWDLRQYFRGVRGGEFSWTELGWFAWLAAINKIRWWRGKDPCGMLRGPRQQTTSKSLDLQPGEWVAVRGRDAIAATLDHHGKNRGLAFVAEMALHCGRRFRVAHRVDRMVVEGTGQLRELRSTVALEDVFCLGLAQRGCPRRCFHLWREAWLERVSQPSVDDASDAVRNQSQQTSCDTRNGATRNSGLLPILHD